MEDFSGYAFSDGQQQSRNNDSLSDFAARELAPALGRQQVAMHDRRANDAAMNQLPQFEIRLPGQGESYDEHHARIHDYACQLMSGRITDQVRNYLIDSMKSGGPNALRNNVQELNQEIIEMTKHLPQRQQLRLIYSHTRDPRSYQDIYSVGLIHKQSGRTLDYMQFVGR